VTLSLSFNFIRVQFFFFSSFLFVYGATGSLSTRSAISSALSSGYYTTCSYYASLDVLLLDASLIFSLPSRPSLRRRKRTRYCIEEEKNYRDACFLFLFSFSSSIMTRIKLRDCRLAFRSLYFARALFHKHKHKTGKRLFVFSIFLFSISKSRKRIMSKSRKKEEKGNCSVIR
jgi:hypothetical protein